MVTLRLGCAILGWALVGHGLLHLYLWFEPDLNQNFDVTCCIYIPVSWTRLESELWCHLLHLYLWFEPDFIQKEAWCHLLHLYLWFVPDFNQNFDVTCCIYICDLSQISISTSVSLVASISVIWTRLESELWCQYHPNTSSHGSVSYSSTPQFCDSHGRWWAGECKSHTAWLQSCVECGLHQSDIPG